MTTRLILSILCAALAAAPSHAAPKKKTVAPATPASIEPIEPPSAPSRGVIEFQGDEISLALRMLARRAGINVVVSEQITGNVTLRIEDKSPRDAIDIIARAHDLVVDEKEGVFYIAPKNPPPPGTSKPASIETQIKDSLATMLTPAVTTFYDSLLDYMARPETAKKVARATRALYDALIAEGFTKEEAFRIVVSERDLLMPSPKK